MNIKPFIVNPFRENTFVVSTETGEAMVIDAGCYSPAEEKALADYLTENGLTVKILINTHLHIDHVLGLTFLHQLTGLKTLAHQGDVFWLNQLEAQARMFNMPLRYEYGPVGQFIKENDLIELGAEQFKVLEVPGHSPGSVALYNKKQACIFVGDVLFAGSIGRTDFTGGDYNTLIGGIQQKLLVLPKDTVVYSGHGPSTTIGQEIETNPYL
jgi:hydroxyacylglutathione hydrolase